MTKVQSSIVFICSAATLIGSGLWFYAAPDYEPAIGIIAGVGGMVASYWPFAPKAARLTREQKIAARDKWRPIFQKFFWDQAQHGLFGADVIIHDVARMDTYPDTDEGPGISPWFRCGLIGTYHRGVLLGLRWLHIVQQDDGTWKETNNGNEGTKVILAGAVPYESIESVNWDGDDYYNKTHIFLHFEHKTEPYERIFYAIENENKHPKIKLPNFYTYIADYLPKQPWWKLF